MHEDVVFSENNTSGVRESLKDSYKKRKVTTLLVKYLIRRDAFN